LVSELRERRIALGYHLENIAELMKVRVSLLEHLENISPGTPWHAHEIHTLRRYCDILEVDFEELNIHTAPLHLQRSILAPPHTPQRSLWWYVTAILFLCVASIPGVYFFEKNNTASITLPTIQEDALEGEHNV